MKLVHEIAEFIADRAFSFGHQECRAWALTDFGAWAALAEHRPVLTFGSLAPDLDE